MSRLSSVLRSGLRWALLLWISLQAAASLAHEPATLNTEQEIDLTSIGHLYQSRDNSPPGSGESVEAWLAQQRPVDHVSLFGGNYWFYAKVRNNTVQSHWVVDPTGTLMENIDVHVYVPEMGVQSFATGYRAAANYMMHYGGDVNLPPGNTAQVLVRINSGYFARYPSVYFASQADYRQMVISENVLTLCALGAMLTLAMYNLFIYIGLRDRSLLYYALYLTAASMSWGLTFHVGVDWFGWRNLHWHYLPFMLSAVFNTLFYLEFLQLRKHARKLAWCSRYNILATLALLPICFVSLPYAHITATALISITLMLALVSSMVRLAQGFMPARYFLAAFLALLVPAVMILPANLGLVPSMVRNIELMTLLGATADSILLAFALADKIRLLGREKDEYLKQLNQALSQASTDALTGIANRHAFDRALATVTTASANPEAAQRAMLVMIDLDGLKRINDERGHAHGDGLLREFAQHLSRLTALGLLVYRLGGDEFAVLGEREQETDVRAAMHHIEACLREAGYANCGISYGIAFGSEINSSGQLMMHADARMYLHKTAKRLPAVA